MILLGKEQRLFTAAAIEQLERKSEIKEQREGYKPNGGSLEIKALYQNISKTFDMSSATVKFSPKSRMEDYLKSEEWLKGHQQSALGGSPTDDLKECCKR